MRNILIHVPRRDKETFAVELKEIWLAPDGEEAIKSAEEFIAKYEKKYPNAIKRLEDSLSFCAFPMLKAKKILSANMLKRLNREIRC